MAIRADWPQQTRIARRITQSMRDQALRRSWLRRVAALTGAVVASTFVATGSVGAQPNSVRVVFETSQGQITVAVDTVHAPISSRNFLRYVDGHFYDGGHFFRTVREDNQATDPVHIAVVQVAADPARLHDQFPPIPLERTTTTGLHHLNGTVSMARNVPNSATSGFFILHWRPTCPRFRRRPQPRRSRIRRVRSSRGGHGSGSGDLASAREWSSPRTSNRNCSGISRFPRLTQ